MARSVGMIAGSSIFSFNRLKVIKGLVFTYFDMFYRGVNELEILVLRLFTGEYCLQLGIFVINFRPSHPKIKN